MNQHENNVCALLTAGLTSESLPTLSYACKIAWSRCTFFYSPMWPTLPLFMTQKKWIQAAIMSAFRAIICRFLLNNFMVEQVGKKRERWRRDYWSRLWRVKWITESCLDLFESAFEHIRKELENVKYENENNFGTNWLKLKLLQMISNSTKSQFIITYPKFYRICCYHPILKIIIKM